MLSVQGNRKSRNQVCSPQFYLADSVEINLSPPPNASASSDTSGCDTVNNSSPETAYDGSRPGDGASTSSVSLGPPTIDYRDFMYDHPRIDDENEETVPTMDISLSHIHPSAQNSTLEGVSQSKEEEEKDFQFFLSELSKCFPYVNLFPWAAATLFSKSYHNPALRESVLSVAALIADNDLEKGQGRALHHLTKALKILQSKINTVEIDDGLAISSFLLAHFSLLLGDHVAAKTHLKGMVTVLAKLDPEGMRESVLSPLTIDPLTMLIWRMAKRIDFITSIASGEPPVLPRYPSINVIKG